MKGFAIVLALFIAVQCSAATPLKFKDDGTFTIAQFTDLHHGEGPDACTGDPTGYSEKTVQVMETVLDNEPEVDLVVLTGDTVAAYCDNGTAGWFKTYYEYVTRPMVKRGLKWALTFGNHEDNGKLNREEIVAIDQSYEGSLTQRGPEHLEEVTNYVLPVLAQNTSDISANLWFFDSGDQMCVGVAGWGCVGPKTVRWYQEQSATLSRAANGDVIPGMAFYHIPTQESLSLYNFHDIRGAKNDNQHCSSQNAGLLAAMIEQGDIKALTNGHDHKNDYWGHWHGIDTYFGRKTGYGAYGPPPTGKHGGRVFKFTESPFSIASWIRDEDAVKVCAIVMDACPPIVCPKTLAEDQPLHKPAAADKQYVCAGAVDG